MIKVCRFNEGFYKFLLAVDMQTAYDSAHVQYEIQILSNSFHYVLGNCLMYDSDSHSKFSRSF